MQWPCCRWERGRETLISYTFTAEDASSYGNVDGATNAWVNSQGSAIGGTVSFFWKKGEGYCRDANGSKAYTFASGRATQVGLMYEVYSAVRTMIVLGQILKVVSFCTVFFAKAVCFS